MFINLFSSTIQSAFTTELYYLSVYVLLQTIIFTLVKIVRFFIVNELKGFTPTIENAKASLLVVPIFVICRAFYALVSAYGGINQLPLILCCFFYPIILLAVIFAVKIQKHQLNNGISGRTRPSTLTPDGLSQDISDSKLTLQMSFISVCWALVWMPIYTASALPAWIIFESIFAPIVGSSSILAHVIFPLIFIPVNSWVQDRV